jgi:ABC-2 type transport system permease protein
MRQTLCLAGRELRSALESPGFYAIVAGQVLFAAAWLYFVKDFFPSGLADLRSYFGILPFVLAIAGSAFGMRAWAEEKRSGTFEMLATLPASPAVLAAGKYLGALAAMTLGFIPMFGVPLCAGLLGSFDPGIVAANFAGLLLMESSILAIGLWASSLASSQLQSFLLSVSILLALLLADTFANFVFPRGSPGGVAAWLSMSVHLRSFSAGAPDTRDIAYFLALTGAFHLFTARSLGMRR